MKTKFILFSISILFISCKNDTKNSIDNSTKIVETKIDSSSIKKQEAIKILDEVNLWMKKGITKELSTKKVNEKINPLMDKYQELLNKMNKKDSAYIQKYRIEQVNKMIDLQMQQN